MFAYKRRLFMVCGLCKTCRPRNTSTIDKRGKIGIKGEMLWRKYFLHLKK